MSISLRAQDYYCEKMGDKRKESCCEAGTDGSKKLKLKKVPWIFSCRFRLAVMCFLGLATLQNQRINMSVAVVCMVNQTGVLDLYSNPRSPGTNLSVMANFTPTTGPRVPQQHEVLPSIEYLSSYSRGEFLWDKSLQGLLLGSFFWGYVFTQLPGGWLALNFGAKNVIGWSMVFGSIFSLLCPVVARVHPYLLMMLRFCIGLTQGFVVPGLVGIWTYWAPTQERSQLIGFSMSGIHVGTILTFPVSAILCEYGFDNGWPTIFYFSGTAGLAWALVWLMFIHDSPEKHRRISVIEMEYIRGNVTVLKRKRAPVPWKSVLQSKAYWGIVVAQFCSTWLIFGVLICIPIYMKEVLQFDIRKNGIFSSIPFIGLWMVTIVSGVVADFLIRNNFVGTQNVRKFTISFTGMMMPAVLCVAIGYIDADKWVVAIVLLTIAVSLLGCLWGSGFAINCADIAPKYSSVLFGVTNSLTALFAIFVPYFIGLLTQNQTAEEWQTVFIIAAAITAFGAVFYLVFGSGQIQPWASTLTPPDKVTEIEVTTELNGETTEKLKDCGEEVKVDDYRGQLSVEKM